MPAPSRCAWTEPLRASRMPADVRDKLLRAAREHLDSTQHHPDAESAIERAIAWVEQQPEERQYASRSLGAIAARNVMANEPAPPAGGVAW